MKVVATVLLVSGALLALQTPPVKKAAAPAKPANIYRYEPRSDVPEGISENINVEETKDGLNVTARPGGRDVHLQYDFPLGSRNIYVRINPEIGYTTIAHLKFRAACVVHLRKDGAVEVNRPGVKAQDVEGVWYVSRSVPIQGRPAVVMVEDESAPKKPDDRMTVTGILVDSKGAPAAGTMACVVILTDDGKMSIPINLYGGRLNPASAVADAKGRFTILMDPFSLINLAICEDEKGPIKMPKWKKTIRAATVPEGKKPVDFGKVAID